MTITVVVRHIGPCDQNVVTRQQQKIILRVNTKKIIFRVNTKKIIFRVNKSSLPSKDFVRQKYKKLPAAILPDLSTSFLRRNGISRKSVIIRQHQKCTSPFIPLCPCHATPQIRILFSHIFRAFSFFDRLCVLNRRGFGVFRVQGPPAEGRYWAAHSPNSNETDRIAPRYHAGN
jgi:hypothetical protein